MSRWDKLFKNLANDIASHSLCLNRQIGAIIVKDKRILATGYNGPPEGVPPCSLRLSTDPTYRAKGTWTDVPLLKICPRRMLDYSHGEGRELCPATHAEVNAIINAARIGVSVPGATMYLSCGLPCKNCLSSIINAGISEIVCTSFEAHDELTSWILTFVKLKVRTYEL